MNDIDYFAEENMSATNLISFKNSLPEHLKWRFEKSTEGGPLDVLQGYRGPSRLRNGKSGDSATEEENFGIQRIGYWYGVTKKVNFFPILGWIFFGVVRGFQSSNGFTDWSSIYFDAATGKMIDQDSAKNTQKKNEKAEGFYTLGYKDYESENFEDAMFHYKEAIDWSCATYANLPIFKEMLDKARIKRATQLYKEADHMASKNDLAAALQLYKRADTLSVNSTEHQESRDKQVSILQIIGDQLRDDGSLKEAMQKYNEAHRLTKNDDILTDINNSIALTYGKEGEKLFELEKYADAKDKFELAVKKTKNSFDTENFNKWLEKVHREIEVCVLQREAKILVYVQKYAEGISQYKKALEKTNEPKVKEHLLIVIQELEATQITKNDEQRLNSKNHLQNKTKALTQINVGLELICEGNLLRIGEKFELASAKYDKAEKYFDEAVKLHPSNVIYNSCLKLIAAYFQVYEYNKAKQLINKAKLIFPQKTKVFNEIDKIIESGDLINNFQHLMEEEETFQEEENAQNNRFFSL